MTAGAALTIGLWAFRPIVSVALRSAVLIGIVTLLIFIVLPVALGAAGGPLPVAV